MKMQRLQAGSNEIAFHRPLTVSERLQGQFQAKLDEMQDRVRFSMECAQRWNRELTEQGRGDEINEMKLHNLDGQLETIEELKRFLEGIHGQK